MNLVFLWVDSQLTLTFPAESGCDTDLETRETLAPRQLVSTPTPTPQQAADV